MITGYTVQCVSVTGSPYDGDTSEQQLTATGLSPNTTYNCSVSASNGQGSGPSAHQLVNTLEAREFTDHLCVSACAIWSMQYGEVGGSGFVWDDSPLPPQLLMPLPETSATLW